MRAMRKIPRWVWLALPLTYFLYFYNLTAAGLIGPDEPRYAAVAREMAHSGDWITPRLWGQPWFEKPALLYWMSAAGFRLGLSPELAPRLPVAIVAVLFVGLYWRVLQREFGYRAAWLATLILGTCGGWVAFSQVGVTDLLLTATFSAAMLLALPWIAKGDTRRLPAVAALLGLAVLAKGLVPLVLALPLVWRGRIRDLLRWRVLVPFLAIALPWYILCYLRNGREFLDIFFWQQQFGRFTSGALLHTQPWWFYIPMLVAGMLPWSPLLLVPARRGQWGDARRTYLLIWCVFGLIFFSAATNKLPGYVLPLFPAMAALVGIGLAEAARARVLLTASALLLVAYPIAAQVLPAAIAEGLSRAAWPRFQWTWLIPAGVAAVVWFLDSREKRLAAVVVMASCSTAGIAYLKRNVMPDVDRVASARGLWEQIEPRAEKVCVGMVARNLRYGLNFYSQAPLPDCSSQPEPFAVLQNPGEPPYVTSASNRKP